jgi:hypothetical protein
MHLYIAPRLGMTETVPLCLRGVDRDKFTFCNGSSNMRDMYLSFLRFPLSGCTERSYVN